MRLVVTSFVWEQVLLRIYMIILGFVSLRARELQRSFSVIFLDYNIEGRKEGIESFLCRQLGQIRALDCFAQCSVYTLYFNGAVYDLS